MRLLLIALVAAACGSQSPPPAQSAPPDKPVASEPLTPHADAAPLPADCANACTEIAVCWEEVNPGKEYRQGGMCSMACDDTTPEEQAAFFQCVADSRADCAKMVACG